MRERVEPGAGGNEFGHADRQFRIADDHRRQDLRMKDNFFTCRFGIGDHRRPTDFRTSTSGCGNRDNRRDYIGVGARPPVTNVFKSHIGRVCPAMNATILPKSRPDPPPKAMTPSLPPAL